MSNQEIKTFVGNPKPYSENIDDMKFGVEIEFLAPNDLFAYPDGVYYVDCDWRICTSAGVQELAKRLEKSFGFDVLNDTQCSHNLEWQLKKDSSVGSLSKNYIGGFELVSPILTGEEGLKRLAKAYAVLKKLGCKTNKTCGTHVHFNVNSFFDGLYLSRSDKLPRDYIIKQVSDVYLEYENTVDLLVTKERRDENEFCQPLRDAIDRAFHGRNKEPNAMFECMITCDYQNSHIINANGRIIWIEEIFFYNRYNKVNFLPMERYGTIEVRQLEGTLSFKKVQNWIKLHKCLIHKALSFGIVVPRKRDHTYAELSSYLEWDKEDSTNKKTLSELARIYNRNSHAISAT